MSTTDIRGTIRRYLDLVEGAARSADEAERSLALLLDELALATHGAAPSAPENDQVQAPRREYAGLRAGVASRFPTFGLYRSGGTEPTGELLVGDAIDDITDIAVDLSEVAWLWEHCGETDALWQFHFGFEHHWGAHLRGLQWYVHELRGSK